jgi:hypothetical protein
MTAGKFIKWFVVVLIAANLVLLAGVLLSGPDKAGRVTPNPNGYDDFVKAARALRDTSALDSATNQDILRRFVSTNAAALALVREGLGRECQVSLNLTNDVMVDYIQGLGALKTLGRALEAESRLAEAEHRTNDALDAGLDLLQYSQEAVRGGMLIDRMVGLAIRNMALNRLQHLSGSLDAQQCRRAVSRIAAIEDRPEALADVEAQEKRFSRRMGGVGTRLASMIMTRSFDPVNRECEKFEPKFQAGQRQTRRLMIALATRAYELERGKGPGSASDLVPEYLKALPKDPASGAALPVP